MTYLGNQDFLPSLIVTQRIPEHFDKSGFDKLVQLCKLLLTEENQVANIIQCLNDFYLFLHFWNRNSYATNHIAVEVINNSTDCHILKFLVSGW